MRKSTISTLLFLLLSFIACREEGFLEIESPHKTEITTYLTELASSADSELSSKIQLLQDELNFRSVSAHSLRGGEQVLIVDVMLLPWFNASETVKAAFVVNNGTIVRAHLVSFSNSSPSHNNEVIALLSYSIDPESYSGKMTLFNIFGEIQFFSVRQNGQLLESGHVHAKQDDNARVNGCINWYLTTTYYYFDGGMRTTHEYLFTTCDDGCNTVRIAGKVNCGGGGMGDGGLGGSQPMFPTNPQQGDEYEFTDTDGKTTLYKFVSNTWTITQVILPALLVQSQPSTYPYLITNAPYNGQVLFGPDDFIFIYDAWSGSWVGEPTIEVGGPPTELKITDRKEYFDCFDTEHPARLSIYADQPVPNSNQAYSGENVGHAWLTIKQTVGGVEIIRSFGFYPDGIVMPGFPSKSGVLVNDAQHAFDVNVSFAITSQELTGLINYVTNSFPSTYNLNTMNCTGFVVNACGAAGLLLPQNIGSWPGGSGLNPGQFGQDLRTMDLSNKIESKVLNGGNASVNKGDCSEIL